MKMTLKWKNSKKPNTTKYTNNLFHQRKEKTIRLVKDRKL